MNSLDSVFAPRSIAVIGASQTPGKVGHDIFANILKGGYKGTLYPVNPSADSIQCVKSYPSVKPSYPIPSIWRSSSSPPKGAVQAVEGSIRKGVKGIVIVSAGFREIGKEGAEIEANIAPHVQGARGSPGGAQLPGCHQPGGLSQHEREFLRPHAVFRLHLLHLSERRPLHLCPRFCRRTGLRILQIHLHRQQGGRRRARSSAVSSR